MDTCEIIGILHEYHVCHANDLGICELGLFGSYVKGCATDSSDIDVVVVLAKPDYLTLARIKRDLEAVFNRPVDIIRKRANMNKELLSCIEKEAVYAHLAFLQYLLSAI